MSSPQIAGAEVVQQLQADQPIPTEVKKSTPPVAPKENSRLKTTFNLQNIGKTKVEEKKTDEPREINTGEDKPIDLEILKKVWNDFSELRKNQVAEYQLLKRDFEWRDNKIIVTLNNPIEEPFLQGVRTSLTAYLRDKMSNSSLLVMGVMREPDSSRPMIYTNQEKFNYLLEKNPMLKELKERFGLDAD